MNWITTAKKGLLGFLTFGAAYIATNPQVITSHIPQNISNLTIGGIAAAAIVAITNWIKNRAK